MCAIGLLMQHSQFSSSDTQLIEIFGQLEVRQCIIALTYDLTIIIVICILIYTF